MSISPQLQALSHHRIHANPTVDSEQEEFRKYLENGGLTSVLTRILQDLYTKNPRPSDPLDYFTKAMRAVNFDVLEMSHLKEELRNVHAAMKSLKDENRYLKRKLDDLTAD